MRWNALLFAFLVAGLLIPPEYSSGEAMGEPGYLFVEAPSGLVADIVGVGSYATPVGLALPPGNYTVRITGNVTVIVQVSVVAETSTIVRVDPNAVRDAVSGDGIVSIKAIFNESANYSQEKLHPPFDPFAVPSGGCGGASVYINISKPYPMDVEILGRNRVYITLNGTFMHIGDDSDGNPCMFYVGIFPGGGSRLESIRNVTYTVPWARLEINSTPDDLTIYLNGGHNRYIFYTPMDFYVPAIPHDVYNVTAVGYYGTIRIPVIHRLDTHTVGIADGHYLVESVVKVAPNETYHVNVNMEKIKSALTVERKAVETVPLKVCSKPSNASVVVTDGVLRAFANTPATFLLPRGNYTIIAFKNNLSAQKSVVLGEEGAKVFLRLIPANATLSLAVQPENATVLLNGEEVEVGNLTLSPGRYNLTVKAPGYITKSLEVILAPNEFKSIEVSLERKSAVEDKGIVISPSQSEADGIKLEETPENEQNGVFNDTQTFTTSPTENIPNSPSPKEDSRPFVIKISLLMVTIGAIYIALRTRR